jgi:hypothetical protein
MSLGTIICPSIVPYCLCDGCKITLGRNNSFRFTLLNKEIKVDTADVTKVWAYISDTEKYNSADNPTFFEFPKNADIILKLGKSGMSSGEKEIEIILIDPDNPDGVNFGTINCTAVEGVDITGGGTTIVQKFPLSFENSDLDDGVTTWILSVPHNLGNEFPAVIVYDENGNETDIPNHSVDENNLTMNFAGPITGTYNLLAVG